MTEITLAALATIAGLMAIVTAYLLKWAAEARTTTAAAVVLFLLVMMVAMLGGALLYYLNPGNGSLVDGLWFASAAMSLSVFPVFAIFLKEANRRFEQKDAYVPTPLHREHLFAFSVLGLVVLNEVLMGWTFQLAYGSASAPALGNWSAALTYAVDSPWFLFPMALEMGLSAHLLRGALPVDVRAVFASQAAMMAFSPPALSGWTWLVASVVAGSGLMFAVFVVPMERIYHSRGLAPHLIPYLLVLLPVFGLMLAGVGVWVLYGTGWLFAVSVLTQMTVYFHALILSDQFTGLRRSVPSVSSPRTSEAP